MNQVNLHPAKHEFKRRPTQLNSGPIRARNQKKFAPNPSPIRIRIPVCTSVSIFGISFGSDIQLRWFKLSWRVNLKGYNFFSLPKVRIMTLNGQKSSVNWSLKIWDFLQTGIGFLDLFKGSLGKKERGETWEEKGVPHRRTFFGSLSEEEDLRTKARASCWSTNSDERHKFYLFSFQFYYELNFIF